MRLGFRVIPDGLPVTRYWIWAREDDSDRPPPDPQFEEHLAFLSHHPGFQDELRGARGHPMSERRLREFGGRWQLPLDVVRRAIAADDEHVQLDVFDGLPYVELAPDEYVLHVPRWLTPARKDAVQAWAREVWNWPRLIDDVDSGQAWSQPKAGHRAPQAAAHLDWYDRWHDGESAQEIWDSLDPREAAAMGFETVRSTLRSIHKRMAEIQPSGLRSPGP